MGVLLSSVLETENVLSKQYNFTWKRKEKKKIFSFIFLSVLQFTVLFSHRRGSLFSVIQPTPRILTPHCCCCSNNHTDNPHPEVKWDWKQEDTALGWHARYWPDMTFLPPLKCCYHFSHFYNIPCKSEQRAWTLQMWTEREEGGILLQNTGEDLRMEISRWQKGGKVELHKVLWREACSRISFSFWDA